MSAPADPLAILDALADESAAIEAAYLAAGDRLRPVLLVEYFCASSTQQHRLFVAWRSPAGVLFYLPPYRQSPERDAGTSTAEGRQANMRGGRWNGHAGNLDRLRGWPAEAGLPMKCKHLDLAIPAAAILADADRATPGRPTRRRLPPEGS